MNKKTDELLKVLESKKNFDEYITENIDEFTDKTLSELLNEFLENCGMDKSAVIEASNLDKTYAYQMFSGIKSNPSRDKLIMLCIGMKLRVTDVQTLMKKAGYPQLYPRIKRDSAIIFSVERNLSLMETNELLDSINEAVLV